MSTSSHTGIMRWEVFEVLEQFIFRHICIGCEQLIKFCQPLRLPARHCELSGAFQNPVHHLTRIIGNGSLFIKEGIGAVRQFLVQLRTGPVEYRHEIIADDFYAHFGQFTDRVDINIDIFITGRQADFDIIMNVDTLHHSSAEALGGDLIRHLWIRSISHTSPATLSCKDQTIPITPESAGYGQA